MAALSHQAAIEAATAAYHADLDVLRYALWVVFNAPDLLDRATPEGQSTEEHARYEEKLRETLRLARMLANVECIGVERLALDHVKTTIFDALGRLS